ncbi:hypothetical protein ACR6C2_13460 [Streptomyces sp. INA 01156]
MRQVANGGTATVLVRGRPGTGRSALLAEGAALARKSGLHVLTAPDRPNPPRSTARRPCSPTTPGAQRRRNGPRPPRAARHRDPRCGWSSRAPPRHRSARRPVPGTSCRYAR